MEFWPFFYKLWNCYLVLPLQTLKLRPYPSKHWNSGPTFINIGILLLLFQTLEFCRILYTLAFLSYPSKRRNFSPTFIHIDFFYLILQNLGILALFSLSDIRILSYFYKHSNTYFLLPNPGMFWPFFIHFFFLCDPSKHWNYGPLFIHIGFLILFFKTLEFWRYFCRYCNSFLILLWTGILALFL